MTRDALGPGEEMPTVLVAEDEPMVREFVTEGLSGLGYRVIAAEDGEQALEEFRQRSDEIDLVILDMVMPRLGGPDAFRRMKALKPDVKVIFVSGDTPDSRELAEVIERASAAFLPKPFSRLGLVSKIRELLDPPGETTSV